MLRPTRTPLAPTLAVLLVSLVPAAAAASGSVSVTVVGKHHTLTVRQTYRKILSGEQARDYYPRETARLLGIAARLGPRLDASLGRYEVPYDPAVPVARCEMTKAGPQLPKAGRFPALVVLPGFHAKGREGLAYDVGVTFARQPAGAQLSDLQRRVAPLIAAHAGAAEDEPERDAAALARKLEPLVEQGESLRLQVHPRLWGAASEAARLEARFKALATALRAALEAEAARAKGITLARYDQRLKYYEDTKRLPGLASVHVDTEGAHAVATYALKSVGGADALSDLRRALYAVMARALGQDER
jgi:hypothetical protein